MVYSKEYFTLLNQGLSILTNAYCFLNIEKNMNTISMIVEKQPLKVNTSLMKKYKKDLRKVIKDLKKLGPDYNVKSHPNELLESSKIRFTHSLKILSEIEDFTEFLEYKTILFNFCKEFFAKYPLFNNSL